MTPRHGRWWLLMGAVSLAACVGGNLADEGFEGQFGEEDTGSVGDSGGYGGWGCELASSTPVDPDDETALGFSAREAAEVIIQGWVLNPTWVDGTEDQLVYAGILQDGVHHQTHDGIDEDGSPCADTLLFSLDLNLDTPDSGRIAANGSVTLELSEMDEVVADWVATSSLGTVPVGHVSSTFTGQASHGTLTDPDGAELGAW